MRHPFSSTGFSSVLPHDPADIFVGIGQPLFHARLPSSGRGHGNAPAVAEALLQGKKSFTYPTALLGQRSRNVVQYLETRRVWARSFNRRSSHNAATAARCSSRLPRLHRSISSISSFTSTSPQRCKAMATPSRIRQRESEAQASRVGSSSRFPSASSRPSPTAPHTARNSPGVLTGAISAVYSNQC